MSIKISTILPTFLAFLCAGEFAIPAAAHAMSADGAPAARDLVLQTADGIAIDARLYDANNDDVIVYCHRLLSGTEGGEVDFLARTLTDRYDILTFNFRGHKSSFGTTTVGGDEILDLRAVLSFAGLRGYRRIIVLGAGMGGTVGWRTAEIFGNMDALIVISPSGFSPETAPFIIGLASNKMLTTPLGRVPLRIITKTRLGLMSSAGFPLDLAGLPERIPTLVIQSEKDRFVDIRRIRIIFEGLGESGTLAIVPGRKHAEDLIDRDTLARIRAFLDGLPPREEGMRVSRRGDAAGPIGSPRYMSDTLRVALAGDSPLPESVILDELGKRMSVRILAGDSAAYSPQAVVLELRDIFSIHGYTRTSLAVVDSLPPFTVKTSTPRIRTVSITGNRRLPDEYIRSVVLIGGDYYNAYELDRAIRRLSSQPAIQSVKSHVTARDDGDMDILLTVTERRPYGFLLSTKFTDIDDFAGIGFTWNEVNPTALRYEGRALIGVSEHDFLTFHTLAKDLFQNTLCLSATLFDNISSRDDLDYIFSRQEVHEIGGELAARYRLFSRTSVTLGAFGKKSESSEVSLDMPVTEGSSGGVRCMIDLSGSLPRRFPRFAWRHTFYYEKSGPFKFGDFFFDTYQLNLSGELKLSRNHTSLTTIHGGRQSSSAPPQYEFSLGGMTTLPGYPDDSFIGNRFALASQALCLSARSVASETSVWSPLRLILYGHAGTAWEAAQSFSLDNLRMDAGFEFEYMEILRAGCVWPVGNLREGSPRVYIGWGVHVL
ncbi:MAG: alpha/beta fold hydrolase [Candidatus Krumholzibacteriia bacterium]